MDEMSFTSYVTCLYAGNAMQKKGPMSRQLYSTLIGASLDLSDGQMRVLDKAASFWNLVGGVKIRS